MALCYGKRQEVKVEISMVQEYCELAPPPGELSARAVTDTEEYS